MLDLTPLLEAIISLVATVITIFLIPWLRERFGNEKLNKAKSWVEIAVLAAEKLYGSGNGKKKLAYARSFLAEHNVKLDFDTLKVMVDAEIKKMEQAAKKEEAPIFPEVSD